MRKVTLPIEAVQPIHRQGEGNALILVWTGGLQTAERDHDKWQVLPLLHNGHPHAVGYFTRADMKIFMEERGLRLVAIQQLSWSKGEFNGFWAPIIPDQTKHAIGPANLWSHIGNNIGKVRVEPHFADGVTPANLDEIFDDAGDAERLAGSISISLRNLDNAVEQIAEFYNTEVTNGLANGRTNGNRYATTRDQSLYALVHSFFLHLGSVRDYLATLIAVQLGLNPDDTDRWRGL